MIKLANKVNLPILSIPYDYNFTQIITIINQNRQFNQSIVSASEVSMHSKIYRILEAGNSSKHVIQELAETIRNPIVLLDQHLNITSFTDLPNNTLKLVDILHNDQNQQYIQKYLSSQLDTELRFYQDPINLDLKIGPSTIPTRIFPIKKNNMIISYLLIWNTMHELCPLDIIQLKVAAKYLLLQLQLEYSQNIESYQKRNEMFYNIIRNKYQNEADLIQFIRYYQLNKNANYSILLISISSKHLLIHRQMMNLSTRLNQMLIGYKQKMVCIEYNDSFILLVEDPPADEATYLNSMQRVSKSLLKQLNKESILSDFTMIISPIVSNIRQIYLSFQTALQTLDIYNNSIYFDKTNQIFSYDTVFLKRIIRENLSVTGMNQISERFIVPFNQLDTQNKNDYFKTLQAYYQNHRNVTKAADSLFIHHNTLLYRMSKIEELLKY